MILNDDEFYFDKSKTIYRQPMLCISITANSAKNTIIDFIVSNKDYFIFITDFKIFYLNLRNKITNIDTFF